MLDIVRYAIEAHGGLARWDRIRRISATFVPDGLALEARGQGAFARKSTRVTIDTHRQHTTFDPFLRPTDVGIFEPQRTAVERDGAMVDALTNPRASFVADAPWTAPQLAYFAGYALWTYLTLPFSLMNDGVVSREIDPWTEDGKTWRAVRVSFPESYVTHSSEQTLYFDSRGLIRRQDYSVDIGGGSPAAHYVHGHQNFDGIVFPTRRRIYPRGPDGAPNRDLVVMAADLSDFELEDSRGEAK